MKTITMAIPDVEIGVSDLLSIIDTSYSALNRWIKEDVVTFKQNDNWQNREFNFLDVVGALTVSKTLSLKDRFETAKQAGELIKEKISELNGTELKEDFFIVIFSKGTVQWCSKKDAVEIMKKETVMIIPIFEIVKTALSAVEDSYFPKDNNKLEIVK